MSVTIIAQDIFEADKLILFLLFFIPGFISVKVYDYLMPTAKRDFSKDIFQVVAYSTLNFIAVSIVFAIVSLTLATVGLGFSPLGWIASLQSFINNPSGSYPYGTLLLLSSVLLVFPIVWPPLVHLVLTNEHVAGWTHRSPDTQPWNELFAGRLGIAKGAKCIRITLKDNKGIIQGLFASDSSVSNYPYPEQIYLQLRCQQDSNGEFGAPITGSSGILVFGSEISTLEVYKIGQCGCDKKCVEVANLH